MAVGLKEPTDLLPVAGVELASCSAGIYNNKQRDDITLIKIAEEGIVTAVFTKNQFCAAPVVLAKQHLQFLNPRYLLINAGNANAGTGERGVQDARSICNTLAGMMDVQTEEILPFSTGVIGEYLPLEKMQQSLPVLVERLDPDAWLGAAKAIMTTDTIAKAASRVCEVDGKKITLTGITKGAGMIKPDMATMLAFIATDICIDKSLLQQALNSAVNLSFNRVTVDGDTSTNDACVLMATGKALNSRITNQNDPLFLKFCTELKELCCELAQSIIRDGEGATKFVTIRTKGGSSKEDCLAIAYRVAESPLVKTALTASDANWGRILAAVGSAGVKNLDINQVTIYLDDVCIVKEGQRPADYREEQGQGIMQQSEITITIDLQQGNVEETLWTTDLSYEYIKINAEYRT